MLQENIRLNDGHLSFETQGEELQFHYFWLRHHCPCCVHALTKDRTISPTDVNLDIKATNAHSTGDSIQIEWPDRHQSVFNKTWLIEHSYEKQDKKIPTLDVPRHEMEVEFKDIKEDFVNAALTRLKKHGAILVRTSEFDVEAIISTLTREVFDVIESHYGRIGDLRTDNSTNKNTDQIGYTNDAIGFHTDQAYNAKPPRYQLLYCMRKASTGGENQLVDVKKAAYYLRESNEESFSILAKTPIKLLRRQKAFRSEVSYPLIQMKGDEFKQVRASYTTFAPINLPYNQMRTWYRAYQHLFNILNQPQNQFEFTLGPNDFVIFDNHRMLHGRSGFTGPRWMLSVYFNHN